MIQQFKNNHAIRATLLVLFIFLLLTGCSKKNTNNDLEFTFDNNNNYTGFKNAKKMSVSDAIKNGYYISENGYIVSGEDKWDEFVNKANDNTETQIRMMKIVEDKDYLEYIDFFYRDELYYAFSSNTSDSVKVGYKYLHVLEESKENDIKMFFIVLSNEEKLTYNQVMADLLSSQANDVNDSILVWGIK
ncbi:hypothetical protein [Anaerocolumna sp.]|uniref:hypothetical protein n=1 Tax=Anaerocolumna sp. TaxID=2041569 RepID=UPI0028AEBFEF|nr:hypothetical protein [Anaerocolumna sp.]